MPFHSEHHVCPQVPFFRLPELNVMLRDQLHPMGRTLLAVDREVRAKCIVSEADAARIVEERKRRTGKADDLSWLSRVD
jgi:fatty acid desaturase